MDLQELLADQPSLHTNEYGLPANYAPNEQVLHALLSYLKPGMQTLETGSGYSTIAFAIAQTHHTSISPYANEQECIRAYMSSKNIGSDTVFVTNGSDIALASPGVVPAVLDFVLIDGAHRFPFAIIDFHYTEAQIKIGGMLCVDDVDMPSVRILYQYLLGEKEWKLVSLVKNTAFFERLSFAVVEADWKAQQINKRFKQMGALKSKVPQPIKLLLKKLFLKA